MPRHKNASLLPLPYSLRYHLIATIRLIKAFVSRVAILYIMELLTLCLIVNKIYFLNNFLFKKQKIYYLLLNNVIFKHYIFYYY